jgi:hypothetical protein
LAVAVTFASLLLSRVRPGTGIGEKMLPLVLHRFDFREAAGCLLETLLHRFAIDGERNEEVPARGLTLVDVITGFGELTLGLLELGLPDDAPTGAKLARFGVGEPRLSRRPLERLRSDSVRVGSPLIGSFFTRGR